MKKINKNVALSVQHQEIRRLLRYVAMMDSLTGHPTDPRSMLEKLGLAIEGAIGAMKTYHQMVKVTSLDVLDDDGQTNENTRRIYG